VHRFGELVEQLQKTLVRSAVRYIDFGPPLSFEPDAGTRPAASGSGLNIKFTPSVADSYTVKFTVLELRQCDNVADPRLGVAGLRRVQKRLVEELLLASVAIAVFVHELYRPTTHKKKVSAKNPMTGGRILGWPPITRIAVRNASTTNSRSGSPSVDSFLCSVTAWLLSSRYWESAVSSILLK
jgi:hypothetical protein